MPEETTNIRDVVFGHVINALIDDTEILATHTPLLRLRQHLLAFSINFPKQNSGPLVAHQLLAILLRTHSRQVRTASEWTENWMNVRFPFRSGSHLRVLLSINHYTLPHPLLRTPYTRFHLRESSRPTALDISEDAEHAEETPDVHDAVSGFGRGMLAGLLGKSSGCFENLPDGTKRLLKPPKAYK